MALTAKKRRFRVEFLKDLNATRAAERAGYSPKTAAQSGSRLLKDPDVAVWIAENLEAFTRQAAITVERVLTELEAIAFFDPGDVVTWGKNGVTLRESEALEARARIVVQSITEGKDGQLSIRFQDKIASLNLAGKYLRMWIERHELAGREGERLIPLETARAIMAGEDVELT